MRALLIIGVAVLGWAGSAQAAIWTASKNISGTFYGGNIDDIYVQGFDSSLGTINSITAIVYLSIQDSLIYYTNENTSTIQAVTSIFSFTFAGAGLNYSNVYLPGQGFVSFQGDGTETVSVLASGSVQKIVDQQYFKNFLYGEPFDFVNVGAYSQLTDQKHPFEISTYKINAMAQVVVDYTPVPEPASFILLAMGVAAISVTRHRRAF